MKTLIHLKSENVMKTLQKLAFGCLFLIFSVAANAQTNSKFNDAMQKGMALMDSAKTTADYMATANHFERIAGVEQKNWLPAYYAALSKLYAGANSQESADKKDAYYDAATILIEKAIALEPQNSEIWALSGYIKFMQLYVDPMSRMQNGMNAAIADVEKAKQIDPENPRPYFILAQNTFYTPEAFGGGKERAKPVLQQAAAKFEKQKTGNFLPTWGAGRNKMLLAECN